MKRGTTLIAGIITAGVLATSAIGQSDADKAAVKARQAFMQLNAFNIALLGGMAKGEIEYDAEAAAAAAANLHALAQLDQSRFWPPGTDLETLGDDQTEALAKIWEEGSDIGQKVIDLQTATATISESAGTGLEALRGSIGPLGKACSGCHEEYRKADE